MSRSVKKGPFVQEALLKRVEEMNAKNEKKVLKDLVARVPRYSRISWATRSPCTTVASMFRYI